VGWGVAKDDAQGIVWLLKAAEQEDVGSQFMRGWADESGNVGAPQDYAKAYFWLDLAASGEDTDQKRNATLKRRDEAASHWTPSELSSVQEQVEKWLNDHSVESQ